MRPAARDAVHRRARADQYKSKAVIDTFVYGAATWSGAQTEGLLGRLGMGLAGLASLAVPLAIAWTALGVWLGYAQRQHAARRPQPSLVVKTS